MNQYNVFSEKKVAIMESVNRTLKNMMLKDFSLRGYHNWLVTSPKIVEKYINKKRLVKTNWMKTVQATKKYGQQLLYIVYNHIKDA